MAKLVPLPYYREDYPRTLQYRRRPLNGETPLFVATLPIAVVRDRYTKTRRHTLTMDVAIYQGGEARTYRSYTNPHESYRRPIFLHLAANEHTPRDNYNWLDADEARKLWRRYNTERLIPSEQAREMFTIAARWNDNNWHNGCIHQDRAHWGKTPRYTVRTSTTALTAAWDRTPVLGPYFDMKMTRQLWAHEGGCLSKPCRVCGFRWGNDRLTESIPADILTVIRGWFPDVAPLAEAQPVELFADPLAYPKPAAPDLSWFPAAPDGVIVHHKYSAIVWENADRSRWFEFSISTRDSAVWGAKYGKRGQEGQYLFGSSHTTDDLIRLAAGWLAVAVAA